MCADFGTRSTFSGAFNTGALYKISKASIVWDIFMNIAFYLLFTAVCLVAARPPLAFTSRANRFLDRLHLPRFARFHRMPRPEAVAVCFCGAAKTTSLGIPLVSAMWTTSDNLTRAFIQTPVLLYTIEQVRFRPRDFKFVQLSLRRTSAC